MAVTMNDLTVNFSHLDSETLLEDWHWLIGPSKVPILLTAAGNAFVQDADDDTVHFLEADTAQLSQVAKSPEELRGLLANKDFVTNYLTVSMVNGLIQAGMRLGPGQICSFKVPPVLGGQYAPDNIEMTDIAVHLKDLPEGTRIDGFSISYLQPFRSFRVLVRGR